MSIAEVATQCYNDAEFTALLFCKKQKKNRGSALEGYTTQESGRPFYTIITKFTLCLRCNFLEIIAMWSQFHTLSEFSHCVWKSQKCLGWIFQFWHFTPIFVLLKLTYVVTLFDHGFKFSKTRQIDHFLVFNELFKWDNFCDFQTLCKDTNQQ